MRAVERVIGAMRARFAEPLSIDTLGAVAFFSPFHLDRFFREITGISPGRFLAAVRIAEAKRLLVLTELNITSICYEVGYSSVGTFTRQFTQYVGVQPSQFRRCGPEVCEVVRAFAARDCHIPPESLQHRSTPSPALSVDVKGPFGFDGLVFIGAFESPIPRGWPVACTVSRGCRPAQMVGIPPGEHYFFGLGVTASLSTAEILIGNDCLRGHLGPLNVAHDHDGETARLELHPARYTDPPVVLAVPFMFARRVRALSGHG